jgi:polysaccharide biosynthesis protein PslJ
MADHATPRGPQFADRLRLPAVAFLIIYAGLLLLIPSRLGIAAIGGPGKPSSLWALLGGGLWVLMTLTGNNRRKSRSVRFAAGFLALATAGSYIAGNIVGWYQPADIHQRSDSNWRLVTLSELRDVMISAGDRGLLAMAGWLGILLIAAEGLRSWEELERLVSWIVRFAGVVASLGMLQYFTGINVAAMIQIPGLSTAVDFTTYTRSVLNRVVSTSGHPIEFGVIMASILPLALHRSLYNRTAASWIPTALVGLMVLMSVSRSAVLAAGAALVVLLLGWPNRWRIIAILAAPVLAVAGRAAFPGLLGTIRGLFQNVEGDPSVEGRTQDYPHVIELFLVNPVFGRGLYTWGTYYYRTLDNQTLVTLLEVGLFGILAFTCLILTGVVSGVQCHRFAQDQRRRHLGLSLAASILGMSLSYVTFDTLGFAQAAGLSFLFVGMAGAAWRLAREEREDTVLNTQSASPPTETELGERTRLSDPSNTPAR